MQKPTVYSSTHFEISPTGAKDEEELVKYILEVFLDYRISRANYSSFIIARFKPNIYRMLKMYAKDCSKCWGFSDLDIEISKNGNLTINDIQIIKDWLIPADCIGLFVSEVSERVEVVLKLEKQSEVI